MNKVDKPIEDGMSKGSVIQFMSILASVVIGPEQFEKSSPEFQMLVSSSAGLCGFIDEKGVLEVVNLVDEATVGPLEATDCQKLATLIAGLQKAYYELCETCRPADPTGPAVCSPCMFIKPNEKGLIE
jgi:hypothetical protein